jgi:hypothetical protein
LGVLVLAGLVLVVPVLAGLVLVVPVLVVGRVFVVLPVVVVPVVPVLPVVVEPLFDVLPVDVVPVDVELTFVTLLFELALRTVLVFALLPVSDEQLPPIKAIDKIADNVSVFFIKNFSCF